MAASERQLRRFILKVLMVTHIYVTFVTVTSYKKGKKNHGFKKKK